VSTAQAIAVKKSSAWLLAGSVLIAAATYWSFFGALVLAWLEVLIFSAVWQLYRRRRAREDIRAALQQAGYEVVTMSHRYWRTGPYSIWSTSRLHVVFRMVVRRRADGERLVWARWGRYWFTSPDTLELNWEAQQIDA
jgi:hypothetical protein